jgi:hypothetical protein
MYYPSGMRIGGRTIVAVVALGPACTPAERGPDKAAREPARRHDSKPTVTFCLRGGKVTPGGC